MRSRIGAGVLVAVLAGAATAAAARPSLSVTPATVRAGHSVTVAGSAGGCTVGNTVTLISRAFAPTHTFAGLPAVFTRVRTTGRFLVTTRIPARRKPGRYGITARCGGGNLGVLAHVKVTA
jgi:hypothetical protein